MMLLPWKSSLGDRRLTYLWQYPISIHMLPLEAWNLIQRNVNKWSLTLCSIAHPPPVPLTVGGSVSPVWAALPKYLEDTIESKTKRGPTHRFAELSPWRRPNSVWHHCPFPEKGGSLHKFYQVWLPAVSGTQAINSLYVNWQAILPPFRRTCSGAPCPQDKAVRRFLHH